MKNVHVMLIILLLLLNTRIVKGGVPKFIRYMQNIITEISGDDLFGELS